MSNNIRQRVENSSTTELNLEYAATIMLRVFNAYDTDHNGTLQRKEFKQLLRECGSNLTSRQCDTIISQMDSDGDGLMNFGEFMSFLGRLYQLQFFGTEPEKFWLKAQHQIASTSLPPKPSSPRSAHKPLPKPPTTNTQQSSLDQRNSHAMPSHPPQSPNLANYRGDRPPPLPPTRPKPQLSKPTSPSIHPVARPLPPPPVPAQHNKPSY